MIKIPGKDATSENLGNIYGQEFFRLHANNMSAFRELATLIDETNDYRHERSIIDIGCGHGFLVEALRQRGYKNTYGLEGSSSAEGVWPIKYRNYYTLGDITDKQTSLAVRKTDLVCLFEVGEHIDKRYARQYVQLLTQNNPEIMFCCSYAVSGLRPESNACK